MNQEKPWFKYWPPTVPHSLTYPAVSLHEILRRTAEAHPEQTAVTFLDGQLTYAELDSFSDNFAAGLFEHGVKKGDRVALFLPNIPQFVIAYYGILKAGAVLTAISPLHREREVEHQLVDSEAETIVLLDSLYPIAEAVRQKTKLKSVILTSLMEFASRVPVSSDSSMSKFILSPRRF